MNCYICDNANGVYLPAIVMAFAPDEETARQMIAAALEKSVLHQTFAWTVREIPMDGAQVLWNGDY